MATTTSKVTRLVTVAEDWLSSSIAQGAAKPFAVIAEVTPHLATEMLKRNTDNRQLYTNQVTSLVADIKGGRWHLNGEAIVFAASGELNDGQHRLRAIVEAGVAVQSALVFGVSRESRITLDSGRRRYAQDHLHFDGYSNATTAAAIVRAVLGYELANGAHCHFARHSTIVQQLERARADDGIREAASWGNYAYSYCRSLISGSQIGLALYLLAQIDPLDAGHYCEQVAFGENLKRTDPAYVVRKVLAKTQRRDPRLAVVLRGWRCYRLGLEASEATIHAATPFPSPAQLREKRPPA